MNSTFEQHLQRLQHTVLGWVLVGLLMLLLLAQLAWQDLDNHRAQQQNHHQTQERLQQALQQLHTHLGYGGFIQHYQTMLLTRNATLYAPLAEHDLQQVRTALTWLESALPTSVDQQPLQVLRTALQQHERRFRLALEMLQQNRSTDDIARITFLDDSAAQLALKALASSAQAQTHAAAQLENKNRAQHKLWLTLGAGVLLLTTGLALASGYRQLAQLRRFSTGLQAQTSALVQARDQAENQQRAQAQLLEAVTHELRTPINAIIGFAQLLETDGQLTYEQRDDVLEILKASHQVLLLMDALQEGNHLRGGELPSEP